MSTAPQPGGPGPQLRRLQALVGRWLSSGRTLPGPAGDAVEIHGTDVYEWLPGEFFLIHHVDVRMGDERVRVLEVIGEYDPVSDTYAMRSFDNRGTAGTMRASVADDGVWTFADSAVRATLRIAADGATMAARWERYDDGAWLPWMEMEFVRADSA